MTKDRLAALVAVSGLCVCGREHNLKLVRQNPLPPPHSNNNNRNDGTGVESALKDKRRRRLCYDYAVDGGQWKKGGGYQEVVWRH